MKPHPNRDQEGPAHAHPQLVRDAGPGSDRARRRRLRRAGVRRRTDPTPAAHRQLSPASADARAYEAELDRRQSAVIAAAAPGAKPSAEYRTAFSGFAAKLSDEQVDALRSADGVRRVVRESFFELTTTATSETSARPGQGGIGGSEADLLGLPGGLWKQLGGPRGAGKGMVVGVVDSGVTPESASFAAAGTPPPATWHGTCQAGEKFPAESCTNKLVGARWFADGIGSLPEESYHSPRDEAATARTSHRPPSAMPASTR